MQNATMIVNQMLEKLNCPKHVTPCSRADIDALQHHDEKDFAVRHMLQITHGLSRASGINTRFLECTFENYQVENPGQKHALHIAKRYAYYFEELRQDGRGFLFTGTPGTGKNHLASAIANELMNELYSVILLNVMDLMSKFRTCYHTNESEEQVIARFTRPDLLIIDELGLQRGSVDEMLWLTRLIDKRLYANKPTGFITNLSKEQLHTLLGERTYERLREAASVMVKFNWESYRVKKQLKPQHSERIFK
ncbi:ATP-binding protein [Shewanella surugensis]|uniref:ATP-binding protein n=1 Tax=Shewanella surugensis TaxID=212020 RepID=A0ABT0L770_9GAMM|nr:ATP-binding protein [Shewanella surugensis]MCL1123414.1 ATP-binding protein [Shewanella surugensis]